MKLVQSLVCGAALACCTGVMSCAATNPPLRGVQPYMTRQEITAALGTQTRFVYDGSLSGVRMETLILPDGRQYQAQFLRPATKTSKAEREKWRAQRANHVAPDWRTAPTTSDQPITKPVRAESADELRTSRADDLLFSCY